MAKKGRLTQVEQWAILGGQLAGEDAKSIAAALDRPQKTIENNMLDVDALEEEMQEEVVAQIADEIVTEDQSDLMIKQTKKGNSGVVIMTAEESQATNQSELHNHDGEVIEDSSPRNTRMTNVRTMNFIHTMKSNK